MPAADQNVDFGGGRVELFEHVVHLRCGGGAYLLLWHTG